MSGVSNNAHRFILVKRLKNKVLNGGFFPCFYLFWCHVLREKAIKDTIYEKVLNIIERPKKCELAMKHEMAKAVVKFIA